VVGAAGDATGAATGSATGSAAGLAMVTLAFGLMTIFLAGRGAGSADYPTFTSSFPIEAIISSLEAPEATLA